jgi:hypothetical protein
MAFANEHRPACCLDGMVPHAINGGATHENEIHDYMGKLHYCAYLVTKIHDYTELQRIVTCSDDTIRTMGGYSRRSASKGILSHGQERVCSRGRGPAPLPAVPLVYAGTFIRMSLHGRGPAPPLPYHPTSKRRVVMPPPRIERCTERFDESSDV